MRSILVLACLVAMSPCAVGQIKEERQFGVLFTPELYPQATPRQALGSLMRALEKERYEYLVAFLLERNYVREQLQITSAYFEKIAREHVEGERLDKQGFDERFIRKRARELAEQAGFENLARRVKDKLAGDPEALKELRKLYREGEVVEAADRASLIHPDIKDRRLFFRNVNGRWYIENKMQE
jgi:hypothetical protein